MGATRSRTETQGSPRAHTRARTGTHSTTGYTHVGRSRGGPERGSQGGAAGRHTRTPTPTPRSLSRRAPAKACATGGGSSPPRPAQAGRSARRAGGKGCVPVPCCAGSRGSGRGEALGGGAPAPIKSPYARTDINKPYQATLSRQQADCSPIFVSLFTSRGALHLQPCGWFLSVLACSLGKPSELLLPPGQNKDPQESLSSGATGHPARLLWPLRRPPVAPAPEGSLASLERVSITIRQGKKKDMLGLAFSLTGEVGLRG